MKQRHSIPAKTMSELRAAAQDRRHVGGLTHTFYRYPARFSPEFARAAIRTFTQPGDLVVDPYMGGGTTLVEALATGRRVIGNDLNSLACFISRVKTTPLSKREQSAIIQWTEDVVPELTYRTTSRQQRKLLASSKTKNLSLPRARFIKKAVAQALAELDQLRSVSARAFVRCAILKVSQWALDGRKTHTSLSSFRDKLQETIPAMLTALESLENAVAKTGVQPNCLILNGDASNVHQARPFRSKGERAKLVVTSPPYPCVHVLYHRWQVDGRRETPAPYWIANCNDGQGESYYNFGSRHQKDANDYFASALRTLRSVRRVMTDDATIVQMVAFKNPHDHLPRYLSTMEAAGFREIQTETDRIWREVPNRRWHAALRGTTHSSREVVLVHRTS
jgi:DNA modification methylase